jgi:hypothetical protein
MVIMVMLRILQSVHCVCLTNALSACRVSFSSRNSGPRWRGDTVLECPRLLPTLLPSPILAALCLALATSPLAQAQDAISPPTLPEGNLPGFAAGRAGFIPAVPFIMPFLFGVVARAALRSPADAKSVVAFAGV